MKPIHIDSAATQQRGVTLIELMVSITIGLFILIAIGTAYITTTSTSRQRENQSELNEPARIVMQQLRRDLSNAGYVDVLDWFDPVIPGVDPRPQAASLFVVGNETLINLYQRAPAAAPIAAPMGTFFPGMMPVFGCDGAMAGSPNAMALAAVSVTAPAAVLACGATSATQQSLQVAYQSVPEVGSESASLLAYNPANPTGEGRDCLQQALPLVPPAPGGKYVINRYSTRSVDGVNELVCQGSGSAAVAPIARGVEEFVVRYQVAQPGVAPAVASSATRVAAGGAQARYEDATGVADIGKNPLGWANVTAVEICMVSATAVTGGAAAAGTIELQPTRPTCARAANGSFVANIARAAGDQRLWKRFTSVVSVRNAVFSTPN